MPGPDPRPERQPPPKGRGLRRTSIRQLKPGEPLPDGEPKRYSDPRGYTRLRWKIGPASYVEVYEHRLDAGVPPKPVRVAPPAPRQYAPFRSADAAAKAGRAAAVRATRAAFLADVTRLYDEGKSMIEIGKLLGRDSSNIQRALKQAGRRSRERGDYWPPIDSAEVVRLYVDEELPPDEIAHRLGVGTSRIRKVLRAKDVMRQSGRPRSSRPSYAREFALARPPVLERARAVCEVALASCDGRAVHVHHRKLRSQRGGNETWNLIAVCNACHREIHREVGVAYANGWLVRSTDDASTVPVLLRGSFTILA